MVYHNGYTEQMLLLKLMTEVFKRKLEERVQKTFKVPVRNFQLIMKRFKLITLMPHILPTSPNGTISEEFGDFYPVFYNVFARAA